MQAFWMYFFIFSSLCTYLCACMYMCMYVGFLYVCKTNLRRWLLTDVFDSLGVRYAFDLYLSFCNCQQPRLLKFYQKWRAWWQECKYTNTIASCLLKDQLKDMWLIAIYLAHKEHCMWLKNNDCWPTVL